MHLLQSFEQFEEKNEKQPKDKDKDRKQLLRFIADQDIKIQELEALVKNQTLPLERLHKTAQQQA